MSDSAHSVRAPRIAYCYFGLLRSLHTCVPSHRRHFPRFNEADIFVHTWYQVEAARFWHGAGIESYSKVLSKLARFEPLLENVKSVVIERQHQLAGPDLVTLPGNVEGFWKPGVYLWETIKRGALLVSNYSNFSGSEYDSVVFIRPDVLLKTDFPLHEAMSSPAALSYCCRMESGASINCEDLVFVIKFDYLAQFIKFCEDQIGIQLALGRGVHPTISNPLLEFGRLSSSAALLLSFRYPINFELVRSYSLMSRVLRKIKSAI